MLALDFLRVAFARAMLVGIEVTRVGAPIIGIIAGQPKGLQQRFEPQKHLVLAAPKDVGQDLAGVVIDGVPEPARVAFVPDKRSCTSALGIIHSAQEPATMPSFHRYQWGHCHGTTSLFLRTRAHCSAVGIPHALLAVAERPRCRSPADCTVQATPTQATQSTQTVCRTSPEALLRPV